MHTKGPWTATSEGDAYDISAWDDETVHIAEVCISASIDPDTENKANARLIASAPELYQACHDALFVLQNKTYAATQAVEDTLKDILSEAIRKARGE